MNFKEWCKQHLTERGMFDKEASAVIESVIAAEENEAMEDRWDHNTDDYPESITNILQITLDHHAIKWIDENAPRAWYRGMFVGE